MSALPSTETRIEVRCPYCGQLEFVQLTPVPVPVVVEVKCRKMRCGQTFTIDLSAPGTCTRKLSVLPSD